MCGIAGYLQLDGAPAAVAVVRRMTDAIAHRGPDGEGFWVQGALGLGHRRLAIIDLTDGGRQPMQTDDERWTITYNGELYNYAELKVELRAQGVRFRSLSDTEVILKAVATWGLEPALKRFNGIFAFGLWDNVKRELHLARDRFGVKPLYWMRQPGRVLFGSEAKAIFAHPEVDARIDLTGLKEYLTFQNFYGERTLFDGIRLLPAGTSLTIRAAGGHVPEPRAYYELTFREPENQGSRADLARELGFLFRQAVSRQLVADVDVGAYLSGGLDSGSITAIASRELRHLRTFTCGFDLTSASGIEVVFDERRDAEMMSALWETEHYEIVLKSGDMERIIPKLVWHVEEPRIGQSYPNFYIAGLAGKFNKVVLAGTGGDELFGGYPWRYQTAYGGTPGELAHNTFNTWQRLFPRPRRNACFAPLDLLAPADPWDMFSSVFERPAAKSSPEERVHAIMTFEFKTFLRGLLSVEDKVSMAHGLESRVPFLDNDLVDFAAGLSLRHKLDPVPSAQSKRANAAGARMRNGKQLLRRAFSEFMPPEIVAREKQGFSAPDATWFKGKSVDYVRSRVGHERARVYNFLDYAATRELLDEHFHGVNNHRLLIWSLIYLEQAFETWKLA